MKLRALHNIILVIEMERGTQISSGGIILMNDDGTESGIRPRWMKVYSVGPKVRDIQEGQWIMAKHGRWTKGMILRNDNNQDFTIWGVEEKSVLLVSDDKPETERSASTAN